ncbi:FecR family protein [Polaribacter sp. R2A056_3_33]|uniref:FecR family protein n=1 Tax=Polaribacter sp. R2A056_3_33 TaxID=2745563 RepID=UPI001C4F8580|nr:FecR family protein [Polaribacter sp. R2A056_3_33]QXP70429.1 FecR family protein [Polaribacter sp. R2A056_3_33]
MTEQSFKIILKKYEEGTATQKEIESVESFFDEMQKGGKNPADFKYNLSLKNKIYKRIEKNKKPKIIWRWAIAASIVFLLGFNFYSVSNNKGILFFGNQNKTAQVLKVTHLNEQVKVYLPDGSLVVLNGDSSIEYPKNFNDTIRLVKLKGEAFFDVTKNPKKPFVIESGKIRTKVLGTSFNIRETKNTTEVVVNTGLVNVTSKQESVFIKPNQKVIYKKNTNKLYKKEVNAEVTNLWRKEEVVLEKIKIEELVVELQKLYKIPFVFKTDNLKEEYFYSLKLSKNETLDNLIERINFINEVKLIKNNNMVKIVKK